MGDLSIAKANPIKEKIWNYWKEQGESETPRRYRGISSIGHECDRFLWLNFRGVVIPKFEPRMYRLFNRGHREENVFIRNCGHWMQRLGVNPSTRAVVSLSPWRALQGFIWTGRNRCPWRTKDSSCTGI